jgi:hypothetical protein
MAAFRRVDRHHTPSTPLPRLPVPRCVDVGSFPPKQKPGPSGVRDAVFHPRSVVAAGAPFREGAATCPGSGLLAPGSSYRPNLPMIRRSQWSSRPSSPVTAAGPRRTRTVFPAPEALRVYSPPPAPSISPQTPVQGQSQRAAAGSESSGQGCEYALQRMCGHHRAAHRPDTVAIRGVGAIRRNHKGTKTPRKPPRIPFEHILVPC